MRPDDRERPPAEPIARAENQGLGAQQLTRLAMRRHFGLHCRAALLLDCQHVVIPRPRMARARWCSRPACCYATRTTDRRLGPSRARAREGLAQWRGWRIRCELSDGTTIAGELLAVRDCEARVADEWVKLGAISALVVTGRARP